MKNLILFVLFVLLLFSRIFCTEVHYSDNVGFKQLVRGSDYIVVAEKAEKEMNVEKIQIVPILGWIFSKKFPPYWKRSHNFIVRQVIKGDIEIGKRIKVYEVNNEAEFLLHKDYYLKGHRKSPVFDSYDTKVDYYGNRELILFLSKYNDDYVFFVEGAYEDLKNIDKIRMLLK